MSRSLSSIAPGASPIIPGKGRMVKRINVLPSLTSNWIGSQVGDEQVSTKNDGDSCFPCVTVMIILLLANG